MKWGEVTHITNQGKPRKIYWRDYPDLVESYNNHVLELSRFNLAGGKMSSPTIIKAAANPNPDVFDSYTAPHTDYRIPVDVYFVREYGKYYSLGISSWVE